MLAHLASGSRGGALALGAGFALLVVGQLATTRRARRPPAWMLSAALLAAAAGALAILPGDDARAPGERLLREDRRLRRLPRRGGARDAPPPGAPTPSSGAGLGAYADAVPAWKRAHGEVRLTHAESDALEVAAETGALGLALLGLCALAWAQGLRDRLQAGRDPHRRDLAIACACAAGALLVHELFDFGLRLPALALACATLLGVAAAPLEARRAPAAWPLAAPRVRAGARRARGLRRLARVGSRAARRGATRGEIRSRARRLSRRCSAPHPYLPEAWRGRSQATRALTSRAGVLPAARRAQAAADLERALRLRPSWAEAWGDLAWMRLAAGDARSARAAFETARRLDPTHLPLGVQGAELVYRLDGPRAAVLELRRVRAANPGWNQDEAHRRALRFTQDPALLALLQGTGTD